MALDALLGADESGSRNLRRSDDGAIHHDARDEHQPPERGAAEEQGVFYLAGTGEHGGKRLGEMILSGRPPSCPIAVLPAAHALATAAHRLAGRTPVGPSHRASRPQRSPNFFNRSSSRIF